MEEKNIGGITAEGRKLRPRRPRISSETRGSDSSERFGNQSERRGGGPDTRRSRDYSGRKGGYGERRSYGERRDYGSSERRGYSSEGRSRGNYERDNQERRDYGERGNYGERRSERPRGEGRGRYGSSENRSHGYSERRGYGSNEGRGGYGDRKSFRGKRDEGGMRPQGVRSGGKRPGGFKKNPYQFGPSSEEGIKRMISKRPLVDQIQVSDNDYVPTPIPEEIRLNKYIANSGICSRREADQFIQAGVVTVNGVVVTELGTKINTLKDEVKFNEEVLKGEEKVYVVMNKPKGFVTTVSDSHAEKTVMDLLRGIKYRVFPVGRLDKNTTGVLMFTNDGEMAEKLTHPSYDKKKIYQVILENPLSEEHFAQILEGIELNDGPIKADELEYIDAEDHRKLGIEIHSGKNRIVRRIFESLGYDVKALDRVYFAGLTKKGLKKGEWRMLTKGEANVLKMGAYV